MAAYLQLNGTSDYVLTPSTSAFSESFVEMDIWIDNAPSSIGTISKSAGNYGVFLNTNGTVNFDSAKVSSLKLNGVSATSDVTVFPLNTNVTLRMAFTGQNFWNNYIFTQYSAGGGYVKGRIYALRYYASNGTTITHSFDTTHSGATLTDLVGSANGTVNGGTWSSDATGTTYSGGGTASGVGSASSTEVQIYAGTGTTSGVATASSSEHFIYTAGGTASGVGSASSSETVIAASTTYSGSGTTSGTSSASSTETVTFVSSGTAQGSASVVGNVAVPTTYTDNGTSSGIASASSTETLISSRGVPLNRSYVFLDAARLNPIQVDANLKVVFDYLNSFAVGIGNIVAATSTSFPVTGLSQKNTQYLVTVIPSWNTTYWITGKTTSGFTINFGTAPASDSTLDWRLMR